MPKVTPRVFIVNEPLFRTGQRVFDLRPAQAFGELVHVFPAGQPPSDPSYAEGVLDEALADFGPDDYLLPVGNVALIAATAAVAAVRAGGALNVLVWDGERRVYSPVRYVLWEDEPSRGGTAAIPEPENV